MNLLDMVREAGVVGAGGAGFPTHVKLETKAEYLLLNGAECEPLLRVDQQLMEIYPDEIIKGFEAVGRFIEAKEAIIGIKGKHRGVISILRDRIEALGLSDFVKIGILEDIYPAGDEQVLVYELTGRVVPEAGIPIQVGCVVINSETALNIYNASNNEAVTQTFITVSGDVPNPLTVKVPIGTPVIDVLRLSGIKDFEGYSVIDGGPMMGPVMESLDGYVGKKNKGFIVLKNDHPLIKKKLLNSSQARRINKSACEQCRMCTDICPRYLLGHNVQPHSMMNALNYNLKDLQGQEVAQLCCECNLCELFSCPVGLHPRFANVYFKEKLWRENIKYKTNKTEFKARKSREYRLLPSNRLIARLGLKNFDQAAPMIEVKVEPELVRIMTSQHLGAPAAAKVAIGDHVEVGQQIGEIPSGSLGSNIHSSVAGIVVGIEKDFIEIRRY